MRVVVLSDLHANGRAVEAALAAARDRAPDHLVILGDLLTYGVDVRQVIDLVSDAVTRDGAALLVGNHDQLYFDLADGDTRYFDGLPGWIQESVEHTRAELDVRAFRALQWQTELRLGAVYLAHANPFGFGDWTYLNAAADVVRAGASLVEKGATVGVFGHNHRGALFAVDGTTTTSLGPRADRVALERAFVTNPGSVGQPRSRERVSTMLTLDVGDSLGASIETVEYDVAAHVAALQSSTLSKATKEKLVSFF